MAFSGLKLVGGPFPPMVPDNPKPKIMSVNTARPLQVGNEKGWKLQAVRTFCISRRETVKSLTAATLGGLIFFAMEPANARVVKPETRQKIFEKLQKLREEAGVAKPKIEEGKKSSPSRNPVKSPVVEAILP